MTSVCIELCHILTLEFISCLCDQFKSGRTPSSSYPLASLLAAPCPPLAFLALTFQGLNRVVRPRATPELTNLSRSQYVQTYYAYIWVPRTGLQLSKSQPHRPVRAAARVLSSPPLARRPHLVKQTTKLSIELPHFADVHVRPAATHGPPQRLGPAGRREELQRHRLRRLLIPPRRPSSSSRGGGGRGQTGAARGGDPGTGGQGRVVAVRPGVPGLGSQALPAIHRAVVLAGVGGGGRPPS